MVYLIINLKLYTKVNDYVKFCLYLNGTKIRGKDILTLCKAIHVQWKGHSVNLRMH